MAQKLNTAVNSGSKRLPVSQPMLRDAEVHRNPLRITQAGNVHW